MKIYQVHGIRHQAIIFAHTPEEAVAQAIEQSQVGATFDPAVRPLLAHAAQLNFLRQPPPGRTNS